MGRKTKMLAIICCIILLLLVISLIRGDRNHDPDYEPDTSVSLSGPVKDGNEPPPNPFLADSPWPMSHRNPYCQASSPYMGPQRVMPSDNFDLQPGWGGLITKCFSSPYRDGRRVIWGNNMMFLFKALDTGDSIDMIDMKYKENWAFFDVDSALSGAYTLLDKDGIFYVPGINKIKAYSDEVPGDPESDIKLVRTFELPAEMIRKKGERIVGFNMTYEGMLVIATSGGLVCAVSCSFQKTSYLQLSKDEEISNSIACDENGGIYIVTSKKMHRVQWTGKELTLDEKAGAWTADYETGAAVEGVRLGEGSGATPTLMGVGKQDRFVVITDGQKLMHLVLFWRDRIPADWKQISGTKDRRIAAQVPVTFGDPEAKESLSEQSVCVRGYGAVVVNNQLKVKTTIRMLGIILSGISSYAPYGIEKFQWDPGTRKLQSAWVNKKISMPNGIPAMSAATNLIYNVGIRDGDWTFEAVDWYTGERVFSFYIGDSLLNWYNSAYAATEIGPGGRLYSGTMMGLMRINP